jgi:branched-chain amino acid transport system substrate-binding protein
MTARCSRMLFILLSGAALAAGTGLIPSARAQDKELRIGFIAPMTGILAQVGKDMVDGFNMYLDEAKSEFGGAKVKLIVEDSTGKPDTAVTKAKKLILSDKVQMMVGGVLATEG